MNPLKSKSAAAKRRKSPVTIPAIVGMLESSAHLDALAAEKRKDEEKQVGAPTGRKVDWHGKSYELVELPHDAYSIGITLSAQIVAGQAAELALKYAFQVENPDKVAPQIHWLDDLYRRLSSNRKNQIEGDYSLRKSRHSSHPWPGWQTAEEVFRSGRDYPVLFRYATEEGQAPYEVQPVFLREAVCSVLASLGANVRWGPSLPEPSRPTK